MPNQLPANQLKISLDTRRPLQVETSAEILATVGQSLRAYGSVGRTARVEIIEVQQGSWWVQLLIMAGGVGAIFAGAQGLAEEIRAGKTPFSRAIAAATSEGEAEVCTITTSDDTLEIPKRAMRALAGMIPSENRYGVGPFGQKGFESDPIGGDSASPYSGDEDETEPDYLETEDGEVLTDEDGEPLEIGRKPMNRSLAGFDQSKLKVEGIYEISDGQGAVLTVDGPYEIGEVEREKLPPQGRYMSFQLMRSLDQFGQTYRLIDWSDQFQGAIVELTGRLIEREGGRFVTFETDSDSFLPEVPDDLLSWIPRGALVEIKGFVPEGDPSSLHILRWLEVEEPKRAIASDPKASDFDRVGRLVGTTPPYDPTDYGQLVSTLGQPGNDQFIAVGKIETEDPVAYFQAVNGNRYRIENVDATRGLRSGELAAILENRQGSDDEGVPLVWLIKYQTATWNQDR